MSALPRQRPGFALQNNFVMGQRKSHSFDCPIATGEPPGCDGHSGTPAFRIPSSYRETSSVCR